MAPDRIYPNSADFPTAPAAPASYYKQGIPPPATYRQPRRGRGPCCCCMLWLCSVFTILLFLLGLGVLIFWLVVRPEAPKFEVNSVEFSPLNLNATSSFDTNIHYEITARNPNKRMSFYYSNINVKVEANGDTIGKGPVGDFNQGHKNTTVLTGDLVTNGVTLSSDTLGLLRTESSNLSVYSQIDLKVKVKVGEIKTDKFKIRVKCDLIVDLNATGSQLRSSHCKVKW